MFVRLWGCNLDCRWCDTPYTWDTTGKNGHIYLKADECDDWPLPKVHDELGRLMAKAGHEFGSIDLLVVTGGEPLIQRDACAELAGDWIGSDGRWVEIETNGTRPPLDRNIGSVSYNVSPKLGGSGVVDGLRKIDPEMQARYGSSPRGTVCWKFVITGPGDLAEVETWCETEGVDRSDVWLMPEGRDPATILDGLRMLAPVAIEQGYNLSNRLHVMLWGDERGR